MNYKGQGNFNIGELLEQVRHKKDAVITTEYHVMRIEVSSERALYFFTLPEHPVHPSVIIRRVVEEGGKVKIKTKGHTSADQKLFENWLKQFIQQDQQVRKSFI